MCMTTVTVPKKLAWQLSQLTMSPRNLHDNCHSWHCPQEICTITVTADTVPKKVAWQLSQLTLSPRNLHDNCHSWHCPQETCTTTVTADNVPKKLAQQLSHLTLSPRNLHDNCIYQVCLTRWHPIQVFSLAKCYTRLFTTARVPHVTLTHTILAGHHKLPRTRRPCNILLVRHFPDRLHNSKRHLQTALTQLPSWWQMKRIARLLKTLLPGP